MILRRPFSTLLIRQEKANIIELCLNRENKRNALNYELLQELEANLDKIAKNPTISCVLLNAIGDKVFCSGHDLKEIQESNKEQQKIIFETCTRLMTKFVELPQPTISICRGLATAAGLQLLLSADFSFVHASSTFSTPGVNIGLFCHTPGVALSRIPGVKGSLIKEMLFTGRHVTAPEAYENNLVFRVSNNPDDDARAFAERIACQSSSTIRMGKRIWREQTSKISLKDSYDIATQAMIENLNTSDCKEGISAFLQKRSPKWSQ